MIEERKNRWFSANNRPFYRCGSHIELIRCKEYYGMCRRHEPIRFTRSLFTRVFRSNFSLSSPRKRCNGKWRSLWSSLFARKARVNTERVPPGHPIILLKSNEFNMAAVSVKRSIPLAPKQKISMKIEVWKLEPLCYSLDSHVATLYSSFLWWVLFRAFHKLLEIFHTVSRNFSKSCSKIAQKTIKSCFL